MDRNDIALKCSVWEGFKKLKYGVTVVGSGLHSMRTSCGAWVAA